MNPSRASYLAAGWKEVVDERPATEPGFRAAFAWWRPRRYKVMWDAVKFARVCQRFGWSAWRAPHEARQSREGRASSRPQEGGAA